MNGKELSSEERQRLLEELRQIAQRHALRSRVVSIPEERRRQLLRRLPGPLRKPAEFLTTTPMEIPGVRERVERLPGPLRAVVGTALRAATPLAPVPVVGPATAFASLALRHPQELVRAWETVNVSPMSHPRVREAVEQLPEPARRLTGTALGFVNPLNVAISMAPILGQARAGGSVLLAIGRELAGFGGATLGMVGAGEAGRRLGGPVGEAVGGVVGGIVGGIAGYGLVRIPPSRARAFQQAGLPVPRQPLEPVVREQPRPEAVRNARRVYVRIWRVVPESLRDPEVLEALRLADQMGWRPEDYVAVWDTVLRKVQARILGVDLPLPVSVTPDMEATLRSEATQRALRGLRQLLESYITEDDPDAIVRLARIASTQRGLEKEAAAAILQGVRRRLVVEAGSLAPPTAAPALPAPPPEAVSILQEARAQVLQTPEWRDLALRLDDAIRRGELTPQQAQAQLQDLLDARAGALLAQRMPRYEAGAMAPPERIGLYRGIPVELPTGREPPPPPPPSPARPTPPTPPPPAARAPEPLVGRPATPVGAGAANYVVLPESREQLPVEWQLVPARSLRTSDMPDYPQAYQPRRLSAETIARIASEPDERLVVGSPLANEAGPPIVREDGTVLVGNHRAVALRRIIEDPQKRAQYYAMLRRILPEVPEDAERQGLVLVRVVRQADEGALRRLAREGNLPVARPLTPVEQAVEDARHLSPSVLHELRFTEAGEPAAVGRSGEAIERWASDLGIAADALISREGRLLPAARERLLRALMVRAYGLAGPTGEVPEEARRLLELALEEAEREVSKAARAMAISAGEAAQARELVLRSRPDLDIGPDFVRAARIYGQALETGRPIEELLAQSSFVEGVPSPVVAELTRLLRQERRADVIAEVLKRYWRMAREQAEAAEGAMMMPPERADKGTLLAQAIQRARGEAAVQPELAAMREEPARPPEPPRAEEAAPRPPSPPPAEPARPPRASVRVGDRVLHVKTGQAGEVTAIRKYRTGRVNAVVRLDDGREVEGAVTLERGELQLLEPVEQRRAQPTPAPERPAATEETRAPREMPAAPGAGDRPRALGQAIAQLRPHEVREISAAISGWQRTLEWLRNEAARGARVVPNPDFMSLVTRLDELAQSNPALRQAIGDEVARLRDELRRVMAEDALNLRAVQRRVAAPLQDLLSEIDSAIALSGLDQSLDDFLDNPPPIRGAAEMTREMWERMPDEAKRTYTYERLISFARSAPDSFMGLTMAIYQDGQRRRWYRALLPFAYRVPVLNTLVERLVPQALVVEPTPELVAGMERLPAIRRAMQEGKLPPELARLEAREGARKLAASGISYDYVIQQARAHSDVLAQLINTELERAGIRMQGYRLIFRSGHAADYETVLANPEAHYKHMTREERQVIDGIRQLLDMMERADVEDGVLRNLWTPREPGEKYVPRLPRTPAAESRKAAVEEYIRARAEEGAVGRMPGVAQPFQRERFFETLNQGLAAGVQYERDLGKIIAARWLSSVEARVDIAARSALRSLGVDINLLPGSVAVREFIARMFLPQQVGRLPRTLAAINSVMVPLRATFDLSWSFIQGTVGLTLNPGAWASAVKVMVGELLRPGFAGQWLRANAWKVMEHIEHGGSFRTTWEPFESLAEAPGGVWRTLKRVHEVVFGRFDSAFAMAQNVMAIEMGHHLRRAVRGLAPEDLTAWYARFVAPQARRGLQVTEEEALRAATQLAERLAGRHPMTGVDRTTMAWLRAVFFAPRYQWAALSLIGTALDTGAISGRLALSALASFAATAIGTYTLAALSMGQEPQLDPRSPDFMTLRVGDRRVGLGGPFYALARLFATIATDPRSIADAELTGRDANPLLRYIYSRASPVASLLVDVARRKTYTGERLDDLGELVAHAAMQFLPISVEQAVRERDPVAAVANFVGLRDLPVTPFERFQNALHVAFAEARERQPDVYGRYRNVGELKEADRPAYDALIQGNDTLRRLQEEMARARQDRGIETPQDRYFKRREELLQENIASQQRLDQAFLQGLITAQQWREERARLQRELGARLDELRGATGMDKRENRPPKGSVNDVLDQYYRVRVEDFRDPITGLVDWDAFRREREEVLAKLSPQDRERVQAYLLRFETPLERQFRADLEALEPYFNVDEQVWQAIAQRMGGRWAQMSWQQVQALAAQFNRTLSPTQEMAMARALVSRVQAIARTMRQRLRVQRPDLDARLLMWGYVSSAASPRTLQLMTQLLARASSSYAPTAALSSGVGRPTVGARPA